MSHPLHELLAPGWRCVFSVPDFILAVRPAQMASLMAPTREEIRKLNKDCWDSIGGPFDEGLRKFTLFLEAVLDYIDDKVK